MLWGEIQKRGCQDVLELCLSITNGQVIITDMVDNLEPYLAQLRSVPFVLDAKRAKDDSVRLKTPSGLVVLPFEEKRTHLSKAMIDLIVHQAARSRNLVIFAPSVGRGAAKALEDASVNYVDLDGNCFLHLGKQYIAKIQGQPRVRPLAAERALRAPALKVLFSLIVERDLLAAPTRTIATQAGGVSPQTANDVRHRLIEQGFVLQGKSSWRWNDGGRRRAIELFVSGYQTTLFPSLLLGRFRARETNPVLFENAVVATLAEGTWRFGGGAACERLTQYYRGEQTLIYTSVLPSNLNRELQLVPDRFGPIAFARWPSVSTFSSPHPQCVHPLLVYADLLSENHDRARDAAREMYERFIQPMEQP